jgi:hypothetical protein
MIKRLAIAALVVLASLPCLAGYKVDVTTKPGFRLGLSKILVVSVECYESLDCRDVERQVGAKVPALTGGLTVVPPDEVSQALLELGKAKYDPASREQLLGKFSADAVLEVDVRYGQKGSPSLGKGSEASISLRLVKADGSLLLAGEGSGRARNTISSPENIAREVSERILEKAFERK